MITRKLYEANWSYMSKRRFDAILADNDRDNDKCISHFYSVGDNDMVRVPKQFRAKTRLVANGPLTITDAHDNGTITIAKGSTTQQISIRRVFPC